MSEAKMLSRFWDQRYDTEEYAYGREANDFFSSQLASLFPGNLLLPGEGEGRNAVYAARQGWKVDAFDLSSAGRAKALSLAEEFGIDLSYRVCVLEDFQFMPNHYDAVGLVFFHPDPYSREFLHRMIFESLKPGGTLIFEGFHKDQLYMNSGGPKSPDMLFDEEMLAADFARFDTQVFEKKEIVLNEGPFHQGQATVIRYRGIKPKRMYDGS